MADRQGIEVDYCPTCRGVWLDRGELDKIIERVALTQGAPARSAPQARDPGARDYRAYRDYDDDDDDDHRKKKRRGVLGELFDFECGSGSERVGRGRTGGDRGVMPPSLSWRWIDDDKKDD
jgi:hypothetical protein